MSSDDDYSLETSATQELVPIYICLKCCGDCNHQVVFLNIGDYAQIIWMGKNDCIRLAKKFPNLPYIEAIRDHFKVDPPSDDDLADCCAINLCSEILSAYKNLVNKG